MSVFIIYTICSCINNQWVCTSLQSMASACAIFFHTSLLCTPKWVYRMQNTKFILNYWIETFYFTVNVVSQFLVSIILTAGSLLIFSEIRVTNTNYIYIYI